MNTVNKFNRTNFYTVTDGKIDFNSMMFNRFFKTTITPKEHTVQSFEENRADLISVSEYGTISYWWIILKYNDIRDSFNDIKEGMILRIPNQTDIQNFYMRSRDRDKK